MAAYDLLLAQLAGGTTQDTRLLRLHTLVGRDVLLAERATVWEAVGPHPSFASSREPGRPAEAPPVTGWRAEVFALAADTHLELKRLLGQPVLLELLTPASRTALRPWHGHVTAFELCGCDGGLARYKLTIEPWLAFLAHRRDSWVFQGGSVRAILEELFADYAGRGRLAPAWRFELADEAAYPARSLTTQYDESDLAFAERLLSEEGLFYWFEHEGDLAAEGLGRHTLVIADHNGAFKANAQARVRYAQAGSALPEDTLVRVASRRRMLASRLHLASPDYRILGLRPATATGSTAAAGLPPLAQGDVPGQYAYEDSIQGERLARRQMESLDALRHRTQAGGPWRSAAVGTTFTLTDHPEHDGSDDARDRQVVVSVVHRARNNLGADARAQLRGLLQAIALESAWGAGRADDPDAAQADEPLHHADLLLQRAAVPVRAAALDDQGLPDARLHRRPTVAGVQTALVVGMGAPVHTDRDHRIKLQFHWQRGSRGSHRLTHIGGDNAPANDASGTWVRVAEAWAGANWGANFAPRVGQEVLVAFLGGDIDRPVVVGSVYNARGQDNAQGSVVPGGAAGATGNTPAWFPGTARRDDKRHGVPGEQQGHAHPQALAGYKSQELSSSATGCGGSNQLVFDDSPGQGRVELSTTAANTRLQLGHLLHQQDNQRLASRGHGIDLGTAAWGAVRAAAGLLISAHGKPASTHAARQMDSREPLARLDEAVQLLHELAEGAQGHQAQGLNEPTLKGARRADVARQLDSERGLYAAMTSLEATDRRGAPTASGSPAETHDAAAIRGQASNATTQGGTDSAAPAIGGGLGTVTAWSRPDLVVAAPQGIAWFTPSVSVQSAGTTHTTVAGQDINRLAQRRASTVVRGDITWFAYGKATNPDKPNQETGIRLQAASGSVSLQAQQSSVRADADRTLDIASTQAAVTISAPKQILLAAGGAGIDIHPGGITLKGPGSVQFKAGMKVLAGPGSMSVAVSLKKAGGLSLCELRAATAAAVGGALVAA